MWLTENRAVNALETTVTDEPTNKLNLPTNQGFKDPDCVQQSQLRLQRAREKQYARKRKATATVREVEPRQLRKRG